MCIAIYAKLVMKLFLLWYMEPITATPSSSYLYTEAELMRSIWSCTRRKEKHDLQRSRISLMMMILLSQFLAVSQTNCLLIVMSLSDKPTRTRESSWYRCDEVKVRLWPGILNQSGQGNPVNIGVMGSRTAMPSVFLILSYTLFSWIFLLNV